MMKCFPGSGERGDLRPSRRQLANCAGRLEAEFSLVQPEIVIPVGQLAMERFIGRVGLADVIGHRFSAEIAGRVVGIIPLPHPSGASAWTNAPGNRVLIQRAIRLVGGAVSGR
jgi:uracil-DNA glycosylase